MKLHERAYEGLSIVILGTTPLMPMRIEQSIAEVSPSAELQISSFENYDDAYKHCKSSKNVGLLIIQDGMVDLSFQQVARELGSHFDSTGVPCFSVIYYENSENAFSARIVDRSDKFISYMSAQELLDSSKVRGTLDEIWELLTESFETTLIPPPLQQSISAAFEAKCGSDFAHFHSRITNNLMANANISWLESFAIKWHASISSAQEVSPAFMSPHKKLIEICKLAEHPKSLASAAVVEYLQSKEVIAKKIAFLSAHLSESRIRGELVTNVDEIIKANKPGANFLIRHLSRSRDRLLAFDQDANSFGTKIGNG